MDLEKFGLGGDAAQVLGAQVGECDWLGVEEVLKVATVFLVQVSNNGPWDVGWVVFEV